MKNQRLLSCFGSLAVAAACSAQWSQDPSVNNPIADGPTEQILCKVAATPDGGCYISWFQNEGGNYNVRLQRMDAQGHEAWPHNGILISNHTQNSSLVDYQLISDAQGNAVIVFTDIRDGGDLDPFAYRVSPAGVQLWGADGVTLCDNTIYEPDPRVCQLSNGDFVVVWARLNGTAGGSGLFMQLIHPDGTTQYAINGIALPTGATGNENPAFNEVVAGNAGTFIVVWLRDIRTFSSLRHVRAQMYDAAGAAQWNMGNPVIISSAISVPIAHHPRLITDRNGGAIVGWHDTRNSNAFDCWVQHVTAAGASLFATNGLQVSTNSSFIHLDPAIALAPGDSGEIFVSWSERNASQSLRGINAQKISGAGARLWGNGGVNLIPVDTIDKLFPRVLATNDGCMVFCLDAPATPLPGNRVLGMRVDAVGQQVWPDSPLVITTNTSTKGRLPVDQTPSGAALLAWEDNRNGTTDIYAQLVNQDGTLGTPACSADWNHDSIVNSQDFFDFLTDFFADNADFNHDGITNSQDFFDFLTAFFTCA